MSALSEVGDVAVTCLKSFQYVKLWLRSHFKDQDQVQGIWHTGFVKTFAVLHFEFIGTCDKSVYQMSIPILMYSEYL